MTRNQTIVLSAKLKNALLEIHGHLGAALVQSVPSDDQIIMKHVFDADRMVMSLLREV